MQIRESLLAGVLALLVLPAGIARAQVQPTPGNPADPKTDDRIRLPYVRLYPSTLQPTKMEGRERILVKNDDGSMEMPSILSACHAAKFKRPSGSWRLSSVVVYLGRIGHAEAAEGFKTYVCDANRVPLTSVWRPKSRIKLTGPQWYSIPLPPIDVPDEFYVMVDLKRQPDDRSIVYLGTDVAEPTAKPMIAEPNASYTYELEQIGTWMIRAVLSGDGNRPEDLIDAQVVPDQVLKVAPKQGLHAYRAPTTELKWVAQLPKLSGKAGRLELAWDQKDATVGIRFLGKRGRMIKCNSQMLTVDLPVTEPGVFEVSILRKGFLPAVKRFTVAPGSTTNWKVELKAQSTEEGSQI